MAQDGAMISGRLDAPSKQAVLAKIAERGLHPVWIKEETSIFSKEVTLFQKKIKARDLSIFCRQFSTIINAGVSVIESLDILHQQTENNILRNVIEQVQDKVQTGILLSKAMSEHKEFPPLLVNMVRTGEASGNLDVVLDKIAVYFEKHAIMQNKIKAALAYPTTVAVVAVIAVISLMAFVIPSFLTTFNDLEIALPPITLALITVSGFFEAYWWLITLTLIVGIYGFRKWRTSKKGRLAFDKFKITPILKDPMKLADLNRKIASANFSRTMAIMLSAGLPIISALEVVGDVVNNAFVKVKIHEVIGAISGGQGLAEPLRQTGVFPPLVTHMAKIGEKTGNMETMMEKITVFYEDEVDTAIKRLTTLIEPIILCFLAAVVGFMVGAIMMPTWGMLDGVQGL